MLIAFKKRDEAVAAAAAAAAAATAAAEEGDGGEEEAEEEDEEAGAKWDHLDDGEMIKNVYAQASNILLFDEDKEEEEEEDTGGGGGSAAPRRRSPRIMAKWATPLWECATKWANGQEPAQPTVWEILYTFNVYNQINATSEVGWTVADAAAAAAAELAADVAAAEKTKKDPTKIWTILVKNKKGVIDRRINQNFSALCRSEGKSELFIELGEELNKFLSPISTQSPRSPPAAGGGGGGGQGEATEVDKAVAAWNYTNFQEVIQWLKSKDPAAFINKSTIFLNTLIKRIVAESVTGEDEESAATAATGGGGGGGGDGGDDRDEQIQAFKDLTLSIPLQQTALLFELIDKINNPPPPPPGGGGGGDGGPGSIELLIAQNPGLKAALQIKRRSVEPAPPLTWDQMWDTRTEFLYPTAAAAAAAAAPAAVAAHKVAQTAFQTYFAENLLVPPHAVLGGGYKRQSRKRRRRKGHRTRQKQRKRQGKTQRKTRKRRRRRRRRRTRRN